MIITVTINASVDKYYRVPAYSSGKVNRVDRVVHTAGGKGLNVARVIHALGSPVKAAGIIGGHSGNLICDLLSQEGIDFDFMHAPIESRSCINIIDENGQSTELLESGNEVNEEVISGFLTYFERMLTRVEVVTLSGSVLKGMPETIYRQLVSIAKKKHKKVILDTNGKYLVNGIEGFPTIIKPNRQEIEQIMGVENATIEQLVEHCLSYVEMGVEKVLVSLGHEGALLISEEEVWKGCPPKLEIVNTVGSGDSMVGALAVGLQQQIAPEQLLRSAIAVSAANTLTEKTGEVRKEDISSIYNRTQVTKLR